MKQKKLFVLPLVALALLALFATVYADDSDKDKLGPYKLLTTISIPEGVHGELQFEADIKLFVGFDSIP